VKETTFFLVASYPGFGIETLLKRSQSAFIKKQTKFPTIAYIKGKFSHLFGFCHKDPDTQTQTFSRELF